MPEEPAVMPTCSVPGCTSQAYAIPYLFDIYEHGEIFLQQDKTCPFICQAHLAENESKAEGIRKPRGTVKYPYTNRKGARGFTVYGPTAEQEQRKRDAREKHGEAEDLSE